MWWLNNYIRHICEVSLHCEWASASLIKKLAWMTSCNQYKSAASLQCGCAYKWFFRYSARLNDFLHSVQECNFSPVWVKMWDFRILFRPKDLLHSEHLCNFFPLWVNKWVFRNTAWLNDLLHCAHLWSFSPLWMSRCLFRFSAWLNNLLQSEHAWIFIYPTVYQKVLPQTCSLSEWFVAFITFV